MNSIDPACPDGVPAEVWAYVLRYVPRSLSVGVWEQVRPFVLDVTGKVSPGTRDAAATTLGMTTSLWAWTVAKGLPLDPETVLTPDRVARYVEETFRGRPPGSETTTRARLGRIGRAATRRAPWPGRPTVIPRTPPAGPYLPAEMSGYRRAAAAQRFASTRRALTGAMVLCAGAGATAGQATRALTDGLVRDGGGRWCVTLDEPYRVVPIVEDYLDDALRLAADHPGEPWLSSVQRRESWLGELIGRARLDTALPPLLTFRLRATWQVGRLDAGVPVKTLVRAAGLKTAASLSPLLQWTTNDDDTALAVPAPKPDARGSR